MLPLLVKAKRFRRSQKKINRKQSMKTISKKLEAEIMSIVQAQNVLDTRLIDWRVTVRKQGFDDRALARGYGVSPSLLNSTDARTTIKVLTGDVPPQSIALAAIKELGGMAKAKSASREAAKAAVDKAEMNKANANGKGDATGAKGETAASGGGLTADERVLAAITANIDGMTAAGKAAAIAALS